MFLTSETAVIFYAPLIVRNGIDMQTIFQPTVLEWQTEVVRKPRDVRPRKHKNNEGAEMVIRQVPNSRIPAPRIEVAKIVKD
jgi:hypothetical protein